MPNKRRERLKLYQSSQGDVLGYAGAIHVEGAFGDSRTLCGLALEGFCNPNEEGNGTLEPIDNGDINCPDCLLIIRHCRRIINQPKERKP